MQHIDIDLGGRESQVCIRTPDGEIVYEGKVMACDLARFLERQPHGGVVLETCAEAFSDSPLNEPARSKPRDQEATMQHIGIERQPCSI